MTILARQERREEKPRAAGMGKKEGAAVLHPYKMTGLEDWKGKTTTPGKCPQAEERKATS
jgi:hypothetical protein